MKIRSLAFAAACAIFLTGNVHAGFMSALRERISGSDDTQPADPQQAAQQQPGQQQSAQQTPYPAEKASDKPVDKAKIKAGAEKLKRELNWEKPPSDFFQKYAGTWSGNFWVYSPLGQKQEVHKVQIQYEPQNNGTMAMRTHSFDLISKQWVVEETAVYTISGDSVNVTITRPSGKTSKQTGHYSDGQLFLRAQINDGVEHFRERIDGKRLLVDGFGVYESLKSDTTHIFIGRFLKD